MPNYCSNLIIIRHQNESFLDEIEQRLSDGELLEFLCPSPEGEWNYDWCVENWGTKWDVDGYVNSRQLATITLEVTSAWSPPIQALEHGASQHGYGFDLYYYEEGVGFAGFIEEAGNSDYFTLPTSSSEIDQFKEEVNNSILLDFCQGVFEMIYEEEGEEDED